MIQMSMSKLSLKVFLGVFALMFSASVGLSAECNDDPKECTPKNLCELVTQVINDNKVWSENASAAEHIAFVKELGIQCGVVEITEPCDLDPNECKVKQLCERATTGDDGSKAWNAEAQAHVELAKEYGLSCSVGQLDEATNACDPLKPTDCGNEELCEIASKLGNNRVDWNISNRDAVREAKKRGLDCDIGFKVAMLTDEEVCLYKKTWNYFSRKAEAKKRDLTCFQEHTAKTTCKNDIKKCSNTVVCIKATNKLNGKYIWTRYNRDAVREARNRELLCGVKEEVKKVAGLCTSDTVSQCSDKELCNWASSKGKWSLTNTLQPYVEQAQLRGLSCGVKVEKKEVARCETDAGLCSVAELCEKATNRDRHNSLVWAKGEWSESYVARAKIRNVDCGVLQLNHYKKYLRTSGEYKGDISIYDVTQKSGTHRFYSKPSGWARFWENYDPAIKNQKITKKTNTVFPILKRQFVSLSKLDRIRIQRNLKEKQIYLSKEDGLWGRNTLVALVEYSSKRLKAIDLRNPKIVDILLEQALLDTAYYFKVAPPEIIKEVYTELDNPKILQSRDIPLKSDFLSQSRLKRKQLQYALKELGYYNKSIDGLWGPGTKNSLEDYISENKLHNYPKDNIFNKILAQVKIPNSFASQKPAKSKSKKKTKNTAEKNLLKLLLLGGICATTPDPSACLAGAAGSTSRSKKLDYKSIDNGRNQKLYEPSCYSDYGCSMGEKCVKKPGSSSGICMTKVNEYGIKSYSAPDSNSIGVRSFGDNECNFSTDCPIGFTCDMTYKVCVKR